MFYVATLISPPDRPAVNDELAQKVGRYLPHGRPVDWLAPGIAVDVAFLLDDVEAGASAADSENLLRELASDIRDIAAGEPVDIVIQPHDGRRKQLLVADMDSTMIAQECIDELADYAGFKSRVAAITERAMRGEIAFEPALRERVALLKGLPAAVIDEVIAERIKLMPGGPTLVATMRANGAYTCVVSGGFTAFTASIAATIGFDEQRANTLLTDPAGRLTGEVAEPIVGREAKFDTLIALRQRLHLTREQTLAVGDGANDIPMVTAAGLGVAFHGKPAIREAAPTACIDHGDLTALLYAQGYRREEFVN
ncbi:MAG: phosphoserine phosphatase SerB [Xanthobacteraceae bacterium]